ncbi:MAG: Stp1/IreP family PP2C-type Ser/Thr phosphatase [Clostridia bacterium]|nr:Stp1/IreP family PP2C-type Ser/Thr phosphatase [Clostridia bacterium]
MLQYYGASDVGIKRKENQDRIYFPPEDNSVMMFIVADGMGGANAGGIASRMAIEYARQAILAGFEEAKDDKEKIEELLRTSIMNANKYVYSKSIEVPEYSGMGTTLSIALVLKNKVYIGHVGDSRIYRIRKNIIRQLTRDHSYVQALLQDGSITKEEALHHPQKNMLLKAVGCEETVEPDIMVKGFLKDDILLICSDGLTNMMDVKDIYNEVVSGKKNLEQTCNNLIEHSKMNGGFDNISVILISND